MPLRRLLDPLVLFLVLGAGLFGLHRCARSPAELASAQRIVVTEADVQWIYEAFSRRRLRPPTPAELRGLVDRHVRDEILYREAVLLGLDREDPALRRRLAMKLEYLAKDVGAAIEPSDAELQAFFAANPERYALQPRRAFWHVFVNADERGAEAEADAQALLTTLRAQDVEEKAIQHGDTLLLEAWQPLAAKSAVEAQFGRTFAEALFEQPVGQWEGPILSGFGLHLVRVMVVHPGELPPLGAVRDRVLSDLLSQRQQQALDAYLEALGEKYEVEIRVPLPQADSP